MNNAKKVSIVTPIYNECENIDILIQKLTAVLEGIDYDYEIIAVNDGSTDESLKKLSSLAEKYSKLVVIDFRRNFGQTAAMMAGFDYATGDIIIPIDADLQNDPQDIPKLLDKIDEGYDVVSGWRKNRKDAAIKRNFVSRVANKIISYVSGLNLHDYGCTLKAYRKECVEGIKLYGEMHRFIPIHANLIGAKVTEIPVEHHPRIHGESKYGINRIYKVILDLMVLKFMLRFLKKPMHLFGGIGLFLLGCSFASIFIALIIRFFEGIYLIQTPLPLFSAMTFITGIMCLLMGLSAEMTMRIYFEAQDRKSYTIRNIIKKDS